jgi:hypothetical protein
MGDFRDDLVTKEIGNGEASWISWAYRIHQLLITLNNVDSMASQIHQQANDLARACCNN